MCNDSNFPCSFFHVVVEIILCCGVPLEIPSLLGRCTNVTLFFHLTFCVLLYSLKLSAALLLSCFPCLSLSLLTVGTEALTSDLCIVFLHTEQCDDELPGSQEAVQSQPDDHHLHHSPLLSLLPRRLRVRHIHHVEVRTQAALSLKTASHSLIFIGFGSILTTALCYHIVVVRSAKKHSRSQQPLVPQRNAV